MSDLQTVTEAVFQRRFQTLRPVLEAEARIQQQLVKLDAQAHKARQDSSDADGYKITGTDVLWNGWESATRRQLNMELARLRAQKLAALAALRTAFGRKQAVENLSTTQLRNRLQAVAKKQLMQ
ncbi:hypothetical protein HW561_13595 [Rhodobacteraceae bacterium B1Z28]|uniref:Flagellar export protein FliJ n=1 Tax=Ruegeria haliotis TaxID=2747601 RepID=A0ABX2PUL3_9RHOB|nr:hypothetical protein [Ruegeria haliotis]